MKSNEEMNVESETVKLEENGAAKPAAGETETKESLCVNLLSQEGHSFSVSVKVAKMSEYVKKMIDDNTDEGAEAQEISLPNVRSIVLSKVIEFCIHSNEEAMNEIEKPLKSSNMFEIVQEWFANFVQIEQELLFDLILAANDMGIKPLLDLTCATVASMIRGKTPEEVRKLFDIVNDFTPEEEAKVLNENRWCEET